MSLEKKEHKEFLVLYKSTKKELSKHKFLPWKFNIAHSIATTLVFFLLVYKPAALILDCEVFYSRHLILFSYLIFSLMTIVVVFYSCHQFCWGKELLGKIINNFSPEVIELLGNCQAKVKLADKVSFSAALILPFLSILLIALAFGGKELMWDFAIWFPLVIIIMILANGAFPPKNGHCSSEKKKSSSKR